MMSIIQHDDGDYSKPQEYCTIEKETSIMEEVYAYAIPHSDNAQIEDEQKIYETPCKDDGDYGPIYTEPPTKMEKIYESFEGKRFHKLYHHNIRYAMLL